MSLADIYFCQRFLWVVCQLDQLSRIRTAINKDILRTLPKGLGQTFETILLKLEEEDKHLAKKIFRLIVCSRHPLGLDELVEAVAIEPHTRNFKTLKRNKLLRASDIFDICGSLIRRSRVTGKITLCHYSVHEFLETPTLESGQRNEFFLDSSHGSIDLAAACITYLNLDDFSTRKFSSSAASSIEAQPSQPSDQTFSESPFLDYAASNWWHHLAGAGKSGHDVTWPLLQKFFTPDRGNFEYWAGVAAYIHGAYTYPSHIKPLHVAAIHGLKDLTSTLLKTDPESSGSKAGDGRTALHFALQTEQDEMVDYLIRAGVPLESSDDTGQRPLHLAMELGNEKAVELLVAAGSDVNAALPDGRTPVTIAIENRCDNLLDTLMDSSLETTLVDGRSLLHLAAQTGNEKCVLFLINVRKEGVNRRDRSLWTPLHYAADHGHQTIVKILLLNKALISPGDKNGWTPLHAAMSKHHAECAVLLLQAKSPRSDDTDEGQMDDSYPLGPSSSRGERPTGESNPRDKYGLHREQHGKVASPLLFAVSEGYYEGVEILLNHFGGSYDFGQMRDMKKSLDKALESNKLDILKVLLSKASGSEIQAILGSTIASANKHILSLIRERLRYSNELYYELIPNAIDSGETAVAEFLLDIPARLRDVRILDALFANALRHNCLGAARILAKRGANISLPDRHGRTPLVMAIMSNEHSAARLLCEIGGKECLAARTRNDETALHVLADRCIKGEDIGEWIEVANLLANAGIELSAFDDKEQQICHKAAANNNMAMMEWALEKTLQPDVADIDGMTAIHIAVKHSHIEMTRFLWSHLFREKPDRIMKIVLGDGGKRTDTPIEVSARVRKIEVLNMLLEFEDEAFQALGNNSRPSDWLVAHRTEAMCVAASEGFVEGVSTLLGAAADVSRRNLDGETALHMASRLGHNEIASLLLSKGADVNEPTVHPEETALHLAAVGGHEPVVKLLLDSGATVQDADISAAANGGNLQVMDLLLQSPLGSGKRIPTAVREAALRHAVEAENLPIIRRILAEGTDILSRVADQRSAGGDTILHIAVKWEQTDLVAQILSVGFDRAWVDSTDSEGVTSLVIAISQGTDDIRDLLLRGGASLEPAIAWAKSKFKYPLVASLNALAREERPKG